MGEGAALADTVGALALVDHHAHPVLGSGLSRAVFEELITESDRAAPAGTSRFDSQLGVAIRRWCAPILGLLPAATPEEYLSRRADLGPAEVNRLFLRATGVSCFLVDTGYLMDGMLGLEPMAEAADAGVTEIVRLESVAEQVITAGDATAAGFTGRFRAALWDQAAGACGVKSIIAYRFGLDFDPEPPAAAEVTAAVGRWLRDIGQGGSVRVTDPVLLRHLLWAGIERGLPVQVHTGFGDPDADLRRCNPLFLRGFLERSEPSGVPIMLLHCYPYHRQAGALAQGYPHVYLDVGLALNHVGARASAVVAESLELAPFAKVLFSSDAFGPAELHYLGALQWRRATTAILGGWVDAGDWTAADAARVAEMIGAGNARRVYRLPD
jgi:predicted TIM-barrel fold metal-dependent hydrolase